MKYGGLSSRISILGGCNAKCFAKVQCEDSQTPQSYVDCIDRCAWTDRGPRRANRAAEGENRRGSLQEYSSPEGRSRESTRSGNALHHHSPWREMRLLPREGQFSERR